MKYCENCGTQLPNRAKFCGKCGKEQEILTEEPLTTDKTSEEKQVTMHCPYCMETIIKGARICRFCRSDLVGGRLNVEAHTKGISDTFNWSILMCAAFLVIQVIIIILSLTDLLVLSIEIGYSGYNLYEYSFGLSIFSCFDISKFIEVLQNNAPSFTGQNMSVGLCIFGAAFLVMVTAYLVLFIWRLNELYKDHKWCRNHKKRFVFDGYSIVLSVVFISFIIIAWIYIGTFIGHFHISIVKIGLSPTMIATIVLLCIQIVINVIAKQSYNAVDTKQNQTVEKIYDRWLCDKCNFYNNAELDICRGCGMPRGYSFNADINKWECPSCGRIYPFEHIKCMTCGVNRDDHI